MQLQGFLIDSHTLAWVRRTIKSYSFIVIQLIISAWSLVVYSYFLNGPGNKAITSIWNQLFPKSSLWWQPRSFQSYRETLHSLGPRVYNSNYLTYGFYTCYLDGWCRQSAVNMLSGYLRLRSTAPKAVGIVNLLL